MPKLRNMLAFLQDMNDPDELVSLPTWKAHRLSGTRAGTWSLHVTRNWRQTFWIDADDETLCDIDFEDYHQARKRDHHAYAEPTAPGMFYPR